MDSNDEIFSLHSNEITGFTSTWNVDRYEVLPNSLKNHKNVNFHIYRHVSLTTKSTETNVIASKIDQSTVTAIRQDFGVILQLFHVCKWIFY